MANVVSPRTGTPLRSRASEQGNSLADTALAGISAYKGIMAEKKEQARLDREDARAEKAHQLLVTRENRLVEQMNREDVRADKRLALDEKESGYRQSRFEAEARLKEEELKILREEKTREEGEREAFREIAEQVYLHSQNPEMGMSPTEALQVARTMSPNIGKMWSDSMLQEVNVLQRYEDLEGTRLDNRQKDMDYEHSRSMNPIEFELESAKVRTEELRGDEMAIGNAIDEIERDNAQRTATELNALIVKWKDREITSDELIEQYAQLGFRTGKTVDVEMIANASYAVLPGMLDDLNNLKATQTQLAKFEPYQRPFVFAGMVKAAFNGGKEGKIMLNIYKNEMGMTDKQIVEAIKWYDTVKGGYMGTSSADLFPEWRDAANELFTIEGFNKGISDTEGAISLAEARIKDAISAAQGPHDRLIIETNPEGERSSTHIIHNPNDSPEEVDDRLDFDDIYGP